jgi:hypothetical protein
MLLEVAEIAWEGFERVHAAVRTDPRGRQKGVHADVRAHVIHHVAVMQSRAEELQLLAFVGAQPAAVRARADDPPLALQRARQDPHAGGGRDQAQGQAQRSSERGSMVRDGQRSHHRPRPGTRAAKAKGVV